MAAANLENTSNNQIRRSLRNVTKPKSLAEFDTSYKDLMDLPSGGEGDNSDDEHGFPSNSIMSLDVLARVATETLEKATQNKASKKSQRQGQRKTTHCLNTISLEQITHLTGKQMIEFFTELTSNEMTRFFTFACCFLPKKCKQSYSSFGNESKARNQMISHLNKHVKELTASLKQESQRKFVLETVEGRRRRTAAVAIKKKVKTKDLVTIKANDILSPPKKEPFTSIKPHDDNIENASTFIINPTTKAVKPNNKISPKPKANSSETVIRPYRVEIGVSEQTGTNAVKQVPLDEVEIYELKEQEIPEVTLFQDDVEKRIEQNEQFIIDLLSRSQPHHDHCYTTVFGKKRGIDTMEFETEDEESIVMEIEEEIDLFQPTPMLLFSCDLVPPPDVGPVASEEVIIEDSVIMPVSIVDHDKPWPNENMATFTEPSFGSGLWNPHAFQNLPMSQSYIDLGKPIQFTNNRPTPVMRKRRTEKLGTNEWEKRVALHCINELRSKKKLEKEPLVCKICTDRAFTAAATLTYHYRSHAGIKPFVCLICNTTFTRQHSLNYHMLIHNNQSRFTCKECGRRFRHPSHFKEHMRRHTGETPYNCPDCFQSFKTRNTYKRHLRTRHAKILSAQGVRHMNTDELLEDQKSVRPPVRNNLVFVDANNIADDEIYVMEGSNDITSVLDGNISVGDAPTVAIQDLFSEQTQQLDNQTVLVPIITL